MKKGKLSTTVQQIDIDASGSYSTYLEYNKILRTWFVAFGGGGPALLITNKEIVERLVTAGSLQLVAFLFLFGAGLQVLGAFINKVANWYVHAKYTQLDVAQGHSKYRCAEWIIEQFWFDLCIDLFTIAAFGFAAWLLLTVFA